MTATKPLVLDPKLEELLRAVASDPESTLLRVPRPSRMRSLFDRAEPGQLSSVGGTAAERALLDTHRAELAWLLSEAAMARLIRGDKGRRTVGAIDSNGHMRPTVMPSELRDRVASIRTYPQLPDSELAQRLLYACASNGRSERPSTRSLSTLAFSIEPSPRSRLVNAMALLAVQECRGALAQAGQVIEASGLEHYRAIAWEIVCFSEVGMGRMRHAYRAQMSGLENGSTTTFAPLNRLSVAVQCGDMQEVRIAGAQVDEIYTPEDARILDFTEVVNSNRGVGGWELTREARAVLVSRWAGEQTGASRRILDVLG